MNPMGARQATITLVYLSFSMEIELLGEQNSSCFMLFDRAETLVSTGEKCYLSKRRTTFLCRHGYDWTHGQELKRLCLFAYTPDTNSLMHLRHYWAQMAHGQTEEEWN